MSSRNEKRLSSRAALKRELRGLFEGAGCWTLSLALTLSLIPPTAIAYAMEEGAPAESATSQPAENPQAQPEPETPETPETPDEPSAPEGGGESGSGEEEAAPADEGGDKETPAAPADEDKGGEESKKDSGSDKQSGGSKATKKDSKSGSSDKKDANSTDKKDDAKDDKEAKRDDPQVDTTTVVTPSESDVEAMKNDVEVTGTITPKNTSLIVEDRVVYSTGAIEATLKLNAKAPSNASVSFDAGSVDFDGNQGISVSGSNDTLDISTPADSKEYDFGKIKKVTVSLTYEEETKQVDKDGQTVGTPSKQSKTVTFTKDVDLKTGILKAVVDSTPPKITLDANAPDEVAESFDSASGTKTRVLNLSQGDVEVRVKAEDDSPLKTDNGESSATLSWVFDDGTDAGSPVTANFPKSGDGWVSFGTFGAKDFVDEATGKLKYAVVTFKAEDVAGNPPTTEDANSVKALKLTSETELFKDAAISIQETGSTRKANDSKGNLYFDGEVEARVSGAYLDGLKTITVADAVDGGSSTDLTTSKDGNDRVAAINADGAHKTSAKLVAPHGSTKDVYWDGDEAKVYNINSVKPDIDIAINDNEKSGTGANGELLFDSSAKPTITVTVKSGTEAMLAQEGKMMKLELLDSNGNVVTNNFAFTDENPEYSDGAPIPTTFTYVITEVPDPAEAYSVRVTPVTIFGDEPSKDSTFSFVSDLVPPTVSLSFSGSMWRMADGVAGFNGLNVGELTITVKDEGGLQYVKAVAGIDTDDKSVVDPTEGLPNVANKKEYEIKIPYAQSGNGSPLFIAEGIGKELKITARDIAGNTHTYEYNPGDKDGNTELPNPINGGKIDKSKQVFDVDVKPVEIKSFTVDGVETDNPSSAKLIDGINVYDSATAPVYVKVEDAHFDKDASYVIIETNGKAKEYKDWSISGNTAEMTINDVLKESTDAKRLVYTVTVKANDTIGNATTEKTYAVDNNGSLVESIALDSTAPEVSIKMDKEPDGLNVSGVDYYKQDKVTATIKVIDPFFDDTSVLSYTDESGNSTTTSGWTGGEGEYSIELTFNEDQETKKTLSVKADDLVSTSHSTSKSYADRDGEKSGSYGSEFVVDKTPPLIESVTYDGNDPYGAYEGTDYFVRDAGGTVTFTINVYDPNFDTNASKVQLNDSEGSDLATVGGTWNGWTDNGGGHFTTTVTYSQTPIDATTGKAKKADFKIVAKDFATNETTENTKYKDHSKNGAQNFVVDTDKPKIDSVKFDPYLVGSTALSDPADKDYSVVDIYDAKTVVATIQVKDYNFEDNLDKWSTISPIGGKVTKKWTHVKDDVWEAQVTFTENREGDNENIVRSLLNYVVVDKAYAASDGSLGNDRSEQWSYDKYNGNKAFVLDGTPVKVTVEMSKPVIYTHNMDDYYNDDVVATITVKDNNFSLASTPTGTEAKDSNQWKTSDHRTYTRTLKFNELEKQWRKRRYIKLDAKDMVDIASGKNNHMTHYNYRTTEGDNVTTRFSRMEGSGGASGFLVDKTAPMFNNVNVNAAYQRQANNGRAIQFYNNRDGVQLNYQFYDYNGLRTVLMTDADGQYQVGSKDQGVNEPYFKQGDTRCSKLNMPLVQRRSLAKDAYDGDTSRSPYGTGPVVLRVTDMARNWREWTLDPSGRILSTRTGKASAYENSVALSGYNTNAHPAALVWDSIEPRIELGPKSLEGTYSNQTQTVTCKVTEYNFEYLKRFFPETKVVYFTRYEGNAGRAPHPEEITVGAFNPSGDEWIWSHDCSEDGHYVFEAYFNDAANNPSNKVNIAEFTIDKTPPRIDSIVFDNNNSVYNNGYYNAARTATITVTEHNWDSSLENSFITSNGQIIGWSHNGDTHIGTVVFGTDGDYNLSVRITDRAGNVSTTETVPEFTIDLTAPEMIIFNAAAEGEEDTLTGHAYNDEIRPAVRFTDKTTGKQTFDPNNASLYSLELTPANGAADGSGLSYPTSSSSSGANDLTVIYDDFKREVEYDDVYTFRTTMTDLAGNPAKIIVPEQAVSDTEKGGAAEVKFSVNRFGSNFIVIDPDRYTEKEGFMSPGDFNGEGAQPVQVAEINVSGYGEQGMSDNTDTYWKAIEENHDVAVTHGLDTEALEIQRSNEGDANQDGYWVDDKSDVKDPKTQQSKVPNEWQVYTYNVYGPNFDKDGDYLVAVSSKDVATNDNVSGEYYNHDKKKVDNAQVSFTFDRTAPRIDNVNLENGGLYDHGKYRTVAFSASDNYQMDIAKVLIDGEEAEVEFNEDEGMYYATIEAKSFTPRNIVIKAYDRAGNEETFTIEGARVTNNIIELHWPSLLLLGAAGIGGGVYANRRRKNKNEEQAA